MVLDSWFGSEGDEITRLKKMTMRRVTDVQRYVILKGSKGDKDVSKLKIAMQPETPELFGIIYDMTDLNAQDEV